MKIAKAPHTMVKFLPILLLLAVLVGVFYLGIQVNLAHSEYMHWKSRESVLVKEIQDLRRDAAQNQAFWIALEEILIFKTRWPEKS